MTNTEDLAAESSDFTTSDFEKTHHCYENNFNDDTKNASNSNTDNSCKENFNSNMKFIEVTITGPSKEKNYEPCDLFLNDMARLVPKLIGKNTCKIDILDLTCDNFSDLNKPRLYYIISESNWHLFKNMKERVILTNDKSLGEPLKHKDHNEKPIYMVFDQVSLTRCLSDYCTETGGSFEYKLVDHSELKSDE